MKIRVLAGMSVAVAATAAMAQPACVDLGTIMNTSNDYNVADFSFSSNPTGSTIMWYCFTLPAGTSPSGSYFDVDVFATAATNQADTEIGIYDSLGNMIANDDDDGHSLRSALSFGNTTPRVQPPDPFGFTNGVAANGRDGNLNAATYYLAVGLFNTTFGATNWMVTSAATGTPDPVTVNFRTDIVPAPGTAALLGLGGLVAIRRRR